MLGSSILGSSILEAVPKILETIDSVSATRSLLNCETSQVSVRDMH